MFFIQNICVHTFRGLFKHKYRRYVSADSSIVNLGNSNNITSNNNNDYNNDNNNSLSEIQVKNNTITNLNTTTTISTITTVIDNTTITSTISTTVATTSIYNITTNTISPIKSYLYRGNISISQLNIEVSEIYVGDKDKLEITCLATIPAHVNDGEQFADYKAYSVKGM